MQPIQLTKQQQVEFSAKFAEEMEKLTMSWDKDLQEWHLYAMSALSFANVRMLNIRQEHFSLLLSQDDMGLNMNVIQALCNNLEDRSANEMSMPLYRWAQILKLNSEIATRWQALAAPVQKKLYMEYEIMNRKSKLTIINNNMQ